MDNLKNIVNCKECPWVVKNNHNDNIVGFSKRTDKPHNCHMVNGGKELWNVTEKTKCNGRKEYEKNRDTRGTQRETTKNV
jgi:hypothetical protein